MSLNYNATAERLLEKISFYKDSIDFSVVDLRKPFPIDQLARHDRRVMEWAKEVDREFDYQMSEFQCSWAIVAAMKSTLEEFNTHNGTNLVARA